MSMDAVFKALADKSRRQLLDSLHARNGQTLNDLCEQLDMTRQAASKHLVLLEEANLIAVQWTGREKLHYINPVPINEIAERWISKFEQGHLAALSALKTHLEGDDRDAKTRKPLRVRHLHSNYSRAALVGSDQRGVHSSVLARCRCRC